MDIGIVHYNTPELTTALVHSIRKFFTDADLTIFDNSDRRPFRPWTSEIFYIDNTRGQILDFDAFLAQYPEGVATDSNFGSVKHTMSVDALFDYLPDGFVLMDSDILLTQPIGEFFDYSVAWAGKVYANRFVWYQKTPRLKPELCWINVPMCREHGIRYFDPERTWRLRPMMLWDTGASFLADCRAADLPGKRLNIDEYMVHYHHGSWSKSDPVTWLKENEQFHI